MATKMKHCYGTACPPSIEIWVKAKNQREGRKKIREKLKKMNVSSKTPNDSLFVQEWIEGTICTK